MSSRPQKEKKAAWDPPGKIRLTIFWIINIIYICWRCVSLPVIMGLYLVSVVFQIVLYNLNPQHEESDEDEEIWDRHK